MDAAAEPPLPSSMRLLCVHHGRLKLETKPRDGDPSIEALYEPGFMLKDAKDKLMIDPQYLDDEDAETVVETIKAIIKEAKK